jgi:hypothetical protein
LVFDLNSESLLKVLIRTPSPMYSSLRSVSFRSVVYRYPRQTGHRFRANDIKEFIKTCENLEFLVVGDMGLNDNALLYFRVPLNIVGIYQNYTLVAKNISMI